MLHVDFRGHRISIKLWNGEKIGNTFALDTETTLIVDNQVPDLIIGQVYDGEYAYIINAKDMISFLDMNITPKTRIYMCNAAFDINVINKYLGLSRYMYDMVEEGRVLDIAILYRLVRLAQMGIVPEYYSLDRITFELEGEKLDKNPLIRLTFEKGISDEHIVYAAKDAVATYYDAKSLLAQTYKIEGKDIKCLGHRLQLKADLALDNMRKQKVYVDEERIRKLKKATEKEMLKLAITQVEWGYNPTVKGTTGRYEGVITPILEENEIPILTTATGQILQSSDYLMQIYDHPFVKAYLDYKSDQKLLSTFIKPLIKAGSSFYPNYNLLVATGRTSARRPNIQQQPRKGGIRECILPPEGYRFLGADYSYVELCTLAEWMYLLFGGERELCKVLNSGQDPHYATASLLLGKGIKQVTKEERQIAKIFNFGMGGGLSPLSLKGYAQKEYGVTLSEVEAEQIHSKFLHVYPDINDYLKGKWSEVIFPCGRRRPNCSYTVSHNTPFQGLAADGAKRAMYQIHKEDIFQQTLFVHDELICLCEESDCYNEQAEYLTSRMIAGMRKECPHVLVQAEAVVSDRWYKEAEPVINDEGKLLCYEGLEKE